MVLGLVAAGALVGAAVAIHWRNAAREALRVQHPRSAFHGVSIQARDEACAVAQQLKGVRFLAREAPGLPLPGCSARECTCVYVHFDDRRYHSRRDPYLNKVYMAPEDMVERRREPRGRRGTDHPQLAG